MHQSIITLTTEEKENGATLLYTISFSFRNPESVAAAELFYFIITIQPGRDGNPWRERERKGGKSLPTFKWKINSADKSSAQFRAHKRGRT